MATVEILTAKTPSESGQAFLESMHAAIKDAGDSVNRTNRFVGGCDWLLIYGVGAELHDIARNKQVDAGGRALLGDLGYWGRKKITGYLRMCIDSDHPQQWLDKTPCDPSRWAKHGIALREDADPRGPILLIGLGRKSRAYLKEPDWERHTYARLRKRFPDRAIVFRPKGADQLRLPCKTDATTPIEELLRGASLVVCRHSNAAVDATIAGVPFDAENGAAMWLQAREFTRANRLEFLRRLAFWQWKSMEAPEAWAFAKKVVER